MLSDGEDTSSLVPFDEVLDLAKRSETAIYTIGLRTQEDAQTKGFKEAEFVLRQLAQETGGRAFFPSKVEDLASVYADFRRAGEPVHWSATPRRTPSATAPGAASSSGWTGRASTARTKQGYFGPVR